MKLQYPHARLAVYNQLLLGRTCAEAITAAARECGLQLAYEPVILPEKIARTNCQALDIAQRIFAQEKPGVEQNLSSRLATLLEQYQTENRKLLKTAPLAAHLNSCGGLNCIGLAPVILDLVLQSLDEVAASVSITSIIPMVQSLPLSEHSQTNNQPAD